MVRYEALCNIIICAVKVRHRMLRELRYTVDVWIMRVKTTPQNIDHGSEAQLVAYTTVLAMGKI